MARSEKIRVLVIDDSLLARETIVRAITLDKDIEIAAVAANPVEARNKIIETRPDVITCDVEMPVMNGIEFIRWLLPQYFVPVVMVSAINDKVFEAMEAGAVDFVVKPDTKVYKNKEAFSFDLIQKIKAAAVVKAPVAAARYDNSPLVGGFGQDTGRVIAIGASTGGTEAIFNILHSLPPTVPGILIVQHIPPLFSNMFAERLDRQTSLHVREAKTGDYVCQGEVLIAPGDKHMRIKKVGHRYKVECLGNEKVNGHCPSVDILFDSVAKEAGGKAIGILLTGMGYDGAKGLLTMRRKGCRTIGQDKESSVVYGMPKVAFDIGAVEIQTSLGNIPQVLFSMLKQPI